MTIHRDTLWVCMKEFKIRTKLIICVKHVYKRQEVRLEQNEHCHLFFENKTGFKRGDPLSPILFNLALQKVIQSIKMIHSGIYIGKE